MTMHTAESANWADRLEKLERQNKLFRVTGSALVLLAIVAITLGAAQTGKRSVTANEFVLQDGHGNTRARLSIASKNVSLVFFDESGRQQMSLSSMSDTLGHGHASLALGEGAVKARFTLAATHPDEFATISDGGLFLTGMDTTRIVLSAAGSDSPSIEIADSQGYSTQLGVTKISHPSSGGTQRSSAASLVLLGKDREVLWSAPPE